MFDLLRTIGLLMHLIFFPHADELYHDLEVAHREQDLLQQCKAEAPKDFSFLALAKNKDNIYFAIYGSEDLFGPPLHIKMGNLNQLKDMPGGKMNYYRDRWVRGLSIELEFSLKDNPDFTQTNHLYYHTDGEVETVALSNHSFEHDMYGTDCPKAPKENLLEIIK